MNASHDLNELTHWGQVTHICVSKLTIIGSDNGLSPGRHQAILWPYAVLLLIWTLGANFNEIVSEIHTFSFKKMHLKVSAKWGQFNLGLNVLITLAITIDVSVAELGHLMWLRPLIYIAESHYLNQSGLITPNSFQSYWVYILQKHKCLNGRIALRDTACFLFFFSMS